MSDPYSSIITAVTFPWRTAIAIGWPYSDSYVFLYDTVQTDPFWLCWESFPPSLFHFSPPLLILHPTVTRYLCHLSFVSCSLSLLSPSTTMTLTAFWVAHMTCKREIIDSPCTDKTRKGKKMQQIQKGACSGLNGRLNKETSQNQEYGHLLSLSQELNCIIPLSSQSPCFTVT